MPRHQTPGELSELMDGLFKRSLQSCFSGLATVGGEEISHGRNEEWDERNRELERRVIGIVRKVGASHLRRRPVKVGVELGHGLSLNVALNDAVDL